MILGASLMGHFTKRLWEIMLDFRQYKSATKSHDIGPHVLGVLVWDKRTFVEVQTRSANMVTVLSRRRDDGTFEFHRLGIRALVSFVFGNVLGRDRWKR